MTTDRRRFRVPRHRNPHSGVINVQLLSDAITALEMVTNGRKPESLHALAAGFGLDCLSHEENLGELLCKHLAEAAQGLFRISRGESWRLRP
jgi:hypothetical protein